MYVHKTSTKILKEMNGTQRGDGVVTLGPERCKGFSVLRCKDPRKERGFRRFPRRTWQGAGVASGGVPTSGVRTDGVPTRTGGTVV